MLNSSFLSDVLAKIIATVVGGIILTRLALFNDWVKRNSVPFLVGFLGGVVLTVTITFLFFSKSPSPAIQRVGQVSLPPSMPPISAPKREPQLISKTAYQIYQIPPDLVVDPWASDIESGSSLDFLLLYNRETSFVA
jgi:hypothetical protein